jgi:hypothetical protein
MTPVFERAFLDERRTWRELEKAHWRRRRAARRFPDRLHVPSVTRAIDRLRRDEDDADCVHDSCAKALTILWHNVSQRLEPVAIRTDAELASEISYGDARLFVAALVRDGLVEIESPRMDPKLVAGFLLRPRASLERQR